MKVEPAANGKVRVTLDERDALYLAVILAYAANGYEQEGSEEDTRCARVVFNKLAAVCEHLHSDADTYASKQTCGRNAAYHATRKKLDPSYERSTT